MRLAWQHFLWKAEVWGNKTKLTFSIKIKQNTPRESRDSVSIRSSGISVFTVLSVFKALCHKAILFIIMLHYKPGILFIQTHFNSSQRGVCVRRGVCACERSVHYALGLTFDRPCSPVSKTKAGPDGHLMCTAIYCQSAWGNKEQPCYCNSLSRGPPIWKSLACTIWRGSERDRISETVWMCVLVCFIVFVWSVTVWQTSQWLKWRSVEISPQRTRLQRFKEYLCSLVRIQ